MKSPLRRLRGFGHHHLKERKSHHRPPPAKLDELVCAAQEVEDMRNCYDGLISAAAATTNSVYEFSEALEEMGSCFLAKTALNGDDDDSGRVLMMLGKVQFELQKFVDTYNLLKELQTVEEMKHQCDDKRRGLKCLEALEPHVKAIAERQHIDYQFNGLEDDESDNDDYSSDQDNCSDDEELSFDYEINDRDQDFLASRGSVDEEVKQIKGDVPPQLKPDIGMHSAPLFASNLSDPSERIWQMKPASAKHSYKLPTPVDDKNPRSVGSHKSHHSQQFESKSRIAANLWHSSPLTKDFKPSGHVKMQSNTEGISTFSQSISDYKKRESWSGPIPIKAGLSKPSSLNEHRSPLAHPHVMSANLHGHSRQPSSVSPKVSPKILPHPAISPKISELHELPRPPTNVESLKPSGLVGYSEAL
ncbi:hypothetical protein PR202_ga01524 [Eleusine coracana subsp. coracana]|uniref:Hydroxyproline-rich glycoprotein family protein n=1 Tax=Eleusine coracana subsp. coracana TaxID=191504 RepID=A0AAV5BJA2_ELECO|nr:hypothetical protein PR202_ga00837 [Eleusine coracana subsp. coracana]GJM85730.1 hypothetical protein PR202_ga01524 [Eleusine coracana subsp. coracana]